MTGRVSTRTPLARELIWAVHQEAGGLKLTGARGMELARKASRDTVCAPRNMVRAELLSQIVMP